MQESALLLFTNTSPLCLKTGLESKALRRTLQNVYSMTQRDGHFVQIVHLYHHLEGKKHGLCQDVTSSRLSLRATRTAQLADVSLVPERA